MKGDPDDPLEMRNPCRHCGNTTGLVETKNGQDCVYCAACGKSARYNASRFETGREVRSLSTRPNIKPSQKWRILERYGHRCAGGCANTESLVIGHLISRHDAEEMGFLDDVIDSEANLAPMCPECNAGLGKHSVSVGLMYRRLFIAWRRSEANK